MLGYHTVGSLVGILGLSVTSSATAQGLLARTLLLVTSMPCTLLLHQGTNLLQHVHYAVAVAVCYAAP